MKQKSRVFILVAQHNANHNSSTFKQQYYDTVDIGALYEIWFEANMQRRKRKNASILCEVPNQEGDEGS
jgi:hypothetical protein